MHQVKNIWEELSKCSTDFPYFAKTYLTIHHPKYGLVPYTLHPYHNKLLKAYEEDRFVILKKFREGGFLTFTCLYALWRAMFNVDQKILITTKSDREAIHIGKVIREVLARMSLWMEPKIDRNNQHQIHFTLTDSTIWFQTIQACRGRALTHLIIDEASFIPKMEEKWKCVAPCLCNNGKCFVLSTTNGICNWFADTYFDADKGKNSFKIVDIDYTEHPDYKDTERVNTLRRMLGEAGFQQEILRNFIFEK